MPGLESGWLSPTAHPAHGSLFPQPKVLNNGREMCLLDDAAGAGWRVVLSPSAFGWSVAVPPDMLLLRISEDGGQGSWQEIEGVMAAWWRRLDCCAAIVRPDHYVYAVVTSETAFQAELHQLSVRRVATLAI